MINNAPRNWVQILKFLKISLHHNVRTSLSIIHFQVISCHDDIMKFQNLCYSMKFYCYMLHVNTSIRWLSGLRNEFVAEIESWKFEMTRRSCADRKEIRWFVAAAWKAFRERCTCSSLPRGWPSCRSGSPTDPPDSPWSAAIWGKNY